MVRMGKANSSKRLHSFSWYAHLPFSTLVILKQVILITTFRGMFLVRARRHRYAGLRSAATSGVDHESHPDILASSLSEQLPLVNPQTRQASQSILVVPPAVSIPTPQAAAKMASAPPTDTIRRFSTSRVIGSTNFSSYNPSDLAMTAVPTPALPIAAQMSSSSRVQFLPSPRGHNHDHSSGDQTGLLVLVVV